MAARAPASPERSAPGSSAPHHAHVHIQSGQSTVYPAGFFALGVDEVAGSVVVQYGDGRGGSDVALLDARTGRVRATPSAFGAGGSVGTIAVDPRSAAATMPICLTPDRRGPGGAQDDREAEVRRVRVEQDSTLPALR
jgi:hypothetical protein